MTNVSKKDDIIMKILHYFITYKDYKPIILNGLNNELWLENFESDLKLIRININYLHNTEQFQSDLRKANIIMKNIKKKTLSLNINMLNILVDASEYVEVDNIKNIETVKVDKVSDLKSNKTITEFFPDFKEKINSGKSSPVDLFAMSNEMNEETLKKEKKLSKIFSEKKPIVTYILMAINVIIFAFMTIPDNYNYIVTHFADNYVLIQNGEIFRLVTSMFLHANLYHLVFNMYALFITGPQVERYYGRSKFILIYFISGVLSSLFSCAFMNSASFGLGASGAIFGLLGSICYFSYHYRATIDGLLRSQMLPVLIMNLVIGLVIPGIDLSAHIGGFIGGILISMAIGLGDKHRKNDQINGFIVLALLFAFMSYILYIK